MIGRAAPARGETSGSFRRTGMADQRRLRLIPAIEKPRREKNLKKPQRTTPRVRGGNGPVPTQERRVFCRYNGTAEPAIG